MKKTLLTLTAVSLALTATASFANTAVVHSKAASGAYNVTVNNQNLSSDVTTGAQAAAAGFPAKVYANSIAKGYVAHPSTAGSQMVEYYVRYNGLNYGCVYYFDTQALNMGMSTEYLTSGTADSIDGQSRCSISGSDSTGFHLSVNPSYDNG